jgi:tellurite resistance protein TerC
MTHSLIIHTLKQARRLVIIVVGFTVLLIGLALLVLPGPAFVVIPIGLAILATEFAWARRLLARVKREAARAVSAVTGRPQTPSSDKSR